MSWNRTTSGFWSGISKIGLTVAGEVWPRLELAAERMLSERRMVIRFMELHFYPRRVKEAMH
jgi:hypothetical protein